MSVACSHVSHSNREVTNLVIFAKVLVLDHKFHKCQLRAVDEEGHVLVPDGIEAIVFDRLRLLVRPVGLHSINVNAYKRVAYVLDQFVLISGQILSADNFDLEFLFVWHRDRVQRIELDIRIA